MTSTSKLEIMNIIRNGKRFDNLTVFEFQQRSPNDINSPKHLVDQKWYQSYV